MITKAKRESMMLDGNTGLRRSDIVEAVVRENPDKTVAALTGKTGEQLEEVQETGDIQIGITPITVTVDGSSSSGGTGYTVGSKTVTENGVYKASDEDLYGFDKVTVNVPQSTPRLSNIEATENGEYIAENDGVDGYAKVDVNVAAKTETLNVTENGAYTPSAGKDGFSRVDVNVEYQSKELNVTANGTYVAASDNVDGFSTVIVDVPEPPAAPKLGHKDITANGNYQASSDSLDGFSDVTVNVEPELETKSITENGTYTPSVGKDGFSEVTVNVPPTEPELETTSVTVNGTYTPSAGKDGFSEVIVDVQPELETKNVTENGTYTPSEGKDGFSSVTVDVPQTTLEELSVTENGTIEASSGKAYNKVVTNVQPKLENKNITENGTYQPTTGKDGFAEVTVAVTSELETKNITENGTYNPSEGKDGFSQVVVNVNKNGGVTLEEKSVNANGEYTPSAGKDGFSKVTVDVTREDITFMGYILVQKSALTDFETSEYSFVNCSLYNDDAITNLGTTLEEFMQYIADNNSLSEYGDLQTNITAIDPVTHTLPYGTSPNGGIIKRFLQSQYAASCLPLRARETTAPNTIIELSVDGIKYIDKNGNQREVSIDNIFGWGGVFGVVYKKKGTESNSVLEVTQSGLYPIVSETLQGERNNAKLARAVRVNVPLGSTTINSNGRFYAKDVNDYKGFSWVDVHVPKTYSPSIHISFTAVDLDGMSENDSFTHYDYVMRESDEYELQETKDLLSNASSDWEKMLVLINSGKWGFGWQSTYPFQFEDNPRNKVLNIMRKNGSSPKFVINYTDSSGSVRSMDIDSENFSTKIMNFWVQISGV